MFWITRTNTKYFTTKEYIITDFTTVSMVLYWYAFITCITPCRIRNIILTRSYMKSSFLVKRRQYVSCLDFTILCWRKIILHKTYYSFEEGNFDRILYYNWLHFNKISRNKVLKLYIKKVNLIILMYFIQNKLLVNQSF